jgi:hypothetical protein
MTASARRRPADGAEVEAFAQTTVGLTLPTALRRAENAGCTVRDRSEPGWYTDEHDPRRIDIVVRDDIVVEASVG